MNLKKSVDANSQDYKNQIKFSAALMDCAHSGKIPVIPDIKLRSPQEGDLLGGRDPAELARVYQAAGAPALSVVTEPKHFGGSPELLRRIAQSTDLPILRKDFIHHREQLLESLQLGASAVLLIISMLEKETLAFLVDEALKLGLEPFVETHDEQEIQLVNKLKLPMLGINNRNILELEMDEGNVSRTEGLVKVVREGVLVVSESSISSSEDVLRAKAAGADAVLVGTALLKADDPVKMYQNFSEPWRKGT